MKLKLTKKQQKVRRQEYLRIMHQASKVVREQRRVRICAAGRLADNGHE